MSGLVPIRERLEEAFSNTALYAYPSGPERFTSGQQEILRRFEAAGIALTVKEFVKATMYRFKLDTDRLLSGVCLPPEVEGMSYEDAVCWLTEHYPYPLMNTMSTLLTSRVVLAIEDLYKKDVEMIRTYVFVCPKKISAQIFAR